MKTVFHSILLTSWRSFMEAQELLGYSLKNHWMKYLLNTSCVQSTEVNRKFVNVGKTEPEAKVEQWEWDYHVDTRWCHQLGWDMLKIQEHNGRRTSWFTFSVSGQCYYLRSFAMCNTLINGLFSSKDNCEVSVCVCVCVCLSVVLGSEARFHVDQESTLPLRTPLVPDPWF